MSSRKNIGSAAASFASSAQEQFNSLKAALKTAEESLSHLQGALHVAVVKPPRGTIKGSVKRPSLLDRAGESSLGGFLSGQISGSDGFLGDLFGGGSSNFLDISSLGGSFQTSATQFAGNLFNAVMRGQRIR